MALSTRAAGIVGALLLASCGSGDGSSPPPAAASFRLAEAGRAGVTAELKGQRFAATSFAEITRTHPEDSFAAVLIEGNAFEGKSDLYVLTLTLSNGTEAEVPAPGLTLAWPDRPEVTFRPARRGLAAGSRTELRFLWDPGRPVASGEARLVWPR